MTEISLYAAKIGGSTSELFSSPFQNSPAIVLAPAHTQPAHTGCREDISYYAPFKEPIPRLEGGRYASDSIVVRSFPNAVIFRDYGVVRDGNGNFIKETLGAMRFLNPQVSGPSDIPAYKLGPQVVAQGHYVYAAHGNYPVYSHFLLETVCTVYLLRTLFSAGSVSLVIPSSPHTWIDSLLDVIEIPRHARYRLANDRVQFENVILSSLCSVHNTFSPHPVIKDMAQHFLDKWGSKSGKRTRLYVTREGFENSSQRTYADEAALVSLLKDLDFVSLNPATLPFDEQVRLFSTAEIVVGIHGSHLANLIFAPAGCKVVDILHADWAQTGGSFTVNITNLFNQEYAYIIAESRTDERGLTLSLDPQIVFERVRRFLEG